MAGGTFFQFKHYAGAVTQVVAGDASSGTNTNTGGKQALLHTVNINAPGTTVSVYDAFQTSDTTTPIGLWTTQTGSFILDIEVQKGIVIITTGTPDVTVTYR
jgi:hypothetical protein